MNAPYLIRNCERCKEASLNRNNFDYWGYNKASKSSKEEEKLLDGLLSLLENRKQFLSWIRREEDRQLVSA